MASIKVKFRPSTVDGRKGVIFYSIIHQRKVRYISTLYRVMPHEWDEENAMVTTRDSGVREDEIMAIRSNIFRDLERFARLEKWLANSRLSYSADELVEEYHRFTSDYTLRNFMRKIILKFQSLGKIRTAETYRAALNSFLRFYRNRDILLDCLTSEIMEAFEAWHKARGNSPNTISFYTRILRATYHRAVEEGAIENRYPFRHVYTGVDRTVKRAIPLSSIRRIRSLDLTGKPHLDFARDMFLLSFYLRGMSFVDMSFLKKTDLSNGYIIYRRRKTGQQLTIAWTAEMHSILKKYPCNPTSYLLPIIKTEGNNERTIYRNKSYSINKNLKMIGRLAGITTPLTMYVARHSWASAAKANGIPLGVISEGMGHDNESTTRIYLASLDTSAVDNANALILKCLS